MKIRFKIRSITALVLVFSMLLPLFGNYEIKAAVTGETKARSYTDPTSGDVFLGGKYIEIGITKEGSLGTVNPAPQKSSPVIDDVTGESIYFHPETVVSKNGKLGMVANTDADASEEGWNSTTSDYFLPGVINEAWSIAWDDQLKAKGCTIGGDGTNITSNLASMGIRDAKTENKSTENLLCAETTIITEGNIQIIQRISFAPEDKNYQTDVKITNLSEDDLTDVHFMRTFDPDQGRLPTDTKTPRTINVVGHEDLNDKGASVIAYKTDRTTPFIYFTADERAVAGYVNTLYTDAAAIGTLITKGIATITPGSEQEMDGNIFLYYTFPTLNSGKIVEFSYYSSLDTDIDSAIKGMLGLDISSQEIEKEIVNDPDENVSAFVSASIIGEDISDCTISYQWYISRSPDVIATGKIISGEETETYTFIPTGKKYDAGVYYICCQVTAASSDQSITKCSKNLKVTVYNVFDLIYDSNGGEGSSFGERDIREGQSRTIAEADAFTAPDEKHFKEWNTKANGGGKAYDPGDSIVLTDDMTLYAQWKNDIADVWFLAYLDDEQIQDNKMYRFFLVTDGDADTETELQYDTVTSYWRGKMDSEQNGSVRIYTASDMKLFDTIELAETENDSFEGKARLYTVHWDIDADGIVDESEILMEGTIPTHADAYKEESEQTYYVFKGWDKELTAVTEEVTYTAQFESHLKKYKIEWDVDGDGKADAAEQLDYGVLPQHADVEKSATYQYEYQFKGWEPTLEPVTKNQCYKAVFDKIIRQYHVIWPQNPIGYTIVQKEGCSNPVNYNGSYSFWIKPKQGYDSSSLVVTANGKVLTAENGLYTISSIGRDGKDVQVEVTIADFIPPTGTILVNTDSFTTLLENITFDKFYTTAQSVSIEASDIGGGVQSISYYISETAIDKNRLSSLDWIPYVSTFTISPDMRGIIYAKIVDVEGNTTFLSSCGIVIEAPYDNNDIWKYEEVSKFENYIYKDTSDEDVKGSLYKKVRARAVSQKKNKITLKWNKVTDADGYIIYGNKCNQGGHTYIKKKIKTIKNPNTTKWTHKNLKKGRYYKYVVVAYKVIDGKKKVLSVSKCVHAITPGGKYKNPTGLSVKQSSIVIKTGKKKTIKAKRMMPKGSKLKEHTNCFRYESSDKKIAVVDQKGRIKGKSKGTCYVFVYVQNGMYKRIKVKVK